MGLYLAIHFIIWSDLIFYTIDTVLEIWSCHPREFIWNKLILDGKCFNVSALMISTGGINVLSDFAILLLPIISTAKLQMPLKKKIAVMCVFGTGLL
jgi:hypothetical protein